MKIAIIAGHDRYRKHGAYAGGVSENTFWNEFIVDILPRLNPKHTYKVFHRPNQAKYGYRRSVIDYHSRIDAWGAHLDIEMHFNASGNRRVNGHEVLYHRGSRNGKHFAMVMDGCFDKYLPTRDRNLKPVSTHERGGFQLAIGASASILTEAFFGSAGIEPYLRGGAHRGKLEDAFISFTYSI